MDGAPGPVSLLAFERPVAPLRATGWSCTAGFAIDRVDPPEAEAVVEELRRAGTSACEPGAA